MAKNKKQEVKKIGRPTDYTPDLVEKICSVIATSSEGLAKLHTKYDWFPSKETIFRWKRQYKDFCDRYAQAKRDQAEYLIEEIIEISDFSALDVKINDNGGLSVDTEILGRSRLRVDTRKWLASKLIPKLYGDKVQNEHSGPDGKPIEIDSNTKLTLAAIDDRIKHLLE